MTTHSALARAYANIALAKYWGKADTTWNLPAVPSLSLTLAGLTTETRVSFESNLDADELLLDGSPAAPGELRRAAQLLGRVREATGLALYARVESQNHFPTAAGLASSASGFCALAGAALAAAGAPFDPARISALARWSSASAARSVYGGFVALAAGHVGQADLAAEPLYPADYWDLRLVVAVTAEGRKAVGSTAGMDLTAQTSPYYRAWVESAPARFTEVRAGLAERDLARLGRAMEQSTLAMHACALAADPGVLYFQPATLAAIEAVRGLRRDGVQVYFTADAGPHVKALCAASDVEQVQTCLGATPGVLRTLVVKPGPGLEVQTSGGRSHAS